MFAAKFQNNFDVTTLILEVFDVTASKLLSYISEVR